jgi:hypothetical protein
LSSVYGGRRIVQLSSFSAGWLELVRSATAPSSRRRCLLASSTPEGKADVGFTYAVAYGGGKMPLPIIEKAMVASTTGFTNATD